MPAAAKVGAALWVVLGLTACPGPSDDDDAAGDDDTTDDDDATFDPGPCPDPDEPLPDTLFADVSECAGVVAPAPTDLGEFPTVGAAWGDFDGDGVVDLVLTDEAGNRLFRNDGAGRLIEVVPLPDAVARPGIPDAAASFADYDGDGDADLWLGAANGEPNALLAYDEESGWEDVTASAGVAAGGLSTMGAWGDYDADGHLDLFVANYGCYDCDPAPPAEEFALDYLFHGNGDGTFEDVSHLLDPDLRETLSYAAVWWDPDDDGDLDLYVGSERGPQAGGPSGYVTRSLLWRNDGPGCGGWCFSEVGFGLGLGPVMDAMGFAVADYDRDGDLDVAATDTFDVVLFRNDGGAFTDVSLAAGVSLPDMPWTWGIVFFDFDNDGWPDLVVSGGEEPVDDGPSYLFRNLGDGTFEDVSAGSGLDAPGNRRGVLVADYDGDGWLDVLRTGRAEPAALFRNLGGATSDANWLRVRLHGPAAASGARVRVTDSDGGEQLQEVKLGASTSASNDPALHFGLGAAVATEVRIRWLDGAEQTLTDLPERAEVDVLHSER